MGRKYAIRDQLSIHNVTFTVVNWIDIFIRDIYKELIVSSLKYCQENKHLQVHAYCIMTSHVHLILSVSEGNLSDVIRDFKSYTSRQSKTILNDKSQIESRRECLPIGRQGYYGYSRELALKTKGMETISFGTFRRLGSIIIQLNSLQTK